MWDSSALHESQYLLSCLVEGVVSTALLAEAVISAISSQISIRIHFKLRLN